MLVFSKSNERDIPIVLANDCRVRQFTVPAYSSHPLLEIPTGLDECEKLVVVTVILMIRKVPHGAWRAQ
jgi:hypothetical protein